MPRSTIPTVPVAEIDLPEVQKIVHKKNESAQVANGDPSQNGDSPQEKQNGRAQNGHAKEMNGDAH